MLDFTDISVLSFDCYGTLIDWESGILSSLQPLCARYRIETPDRELLELYGRFERQVQHQSPFVNYRGVLRDVAAGFCLHFGINLDKEPAGQQILADSVGDWPAFPDTVEALKRLSSRFKLAIISNIDDDMFQLSQVRLRTEFDWVITSERIGSYKPSPENFHFARRIMGVDSAQHVHVAQSQFHDIEPASSLGWKTVWVNRSGAASTPLVDSQPDLEVPDLASLAHLVVGAI